MRVFRLIMYITFKRSYEDDETDVVARCLPSHIWATDQGNVGYDKGATENIIQNIILIILI